MGSWIERGCFIVPLCSDPGLGYVRDDLFSSVFTREPSERKECDLLLYEHDFFAI